MSLHHAVACPFPAPGHVRPFMAYIIHVVDKYPSIIFTVMLHKRYVQMAHDEIKRSNTPYTTSRRIRIAGIVNDECQAAPGILRPVIAELAEAFYSAYEAITQGQVITCTATGTVFDYHDIPAPKLVIPDFMNDGIGKAARKITPEAKILVHWTCTAAFLVRTSGPKEIGGLASWVDDAKALMNENAGMSFDEAIDLVDCDYTERPWTNPEGVKMYEYELHPQAMSKNDVLQAIIDGNTQLNDFADGLLLSTTESFEPKAYEALQTWYAGELEKKLYCIGARSAARMLSPSTPAASPVSEKHSEILGFLDRHPPKSVWLISFGTIFYPFMHPNYLYATLKALLDSKTPFILARASPVSMMFPLPAELEKSIAESGIGFVAERVPQQEVLRHPSTGAFLTHGGANSMFEFITSGVIPVMWPFAADQPGHAAYLRHKDCAFELIQVRTGGGAKPTLLGQTIEGTDDAIYAEVTQVIEDLKGEIGMRKQKNLEVVRDAFVKAMGEGGAIDAATEDSLRFAFSESGWLKTATT